MARDGLFACIERKDQSTMNSQYRSTTQAYSLKYARERFRRFTRLSRNSRDLHQLLLQSRGCEVGISEEEQLQLQFSWILIVFCMTRLTHPPQIPPRRLVRRLQFFQQQLQQHLRPNPPFLYLEVGVLPPSSRPLPLLSILHQSAPQHLDRCRPLLAPNACRRRQRRHRQ